jgi:uncharacterized protein YxeA
MNNNRINIIKKEDSFLFKNNKIKDFNGNKNNKNNIKIFIINNIFIYSIILSLIIIIIQFITIYNLKSKRYNYSLQNKRDILNINNKNTNLKNNPNIKKINNNKQKYDINFEYEGYDKEIITDKIKRDSGWILGLNEAQFINGIIWRS